MPTVEPFCVRSVVHRSTDPVAPPEMSDASESRPPGSRRAKGGSVHAPTERGTASQRRCRWMSTWTDVVRPPTRSSRGDLEVRGRAARLSTLAPLTRSLGEIRPLGLVGQQVDPLLALGDAADAAGNRDLAETAANDLTALPTRSGEVAVLPVARDTLTAVALARGDLVSASREVEPRTRRDPSDGLRARSRPARRCPRRPGHTGDRPGGSPRLSARDVVSNGAWSTPSRPSA